HAPRRRPRSPRARSAERARPRLGLHVACELVEAVDDAGIGVDATEVDLAVGIGEPVVYDLAERVAADAARGQDLVDPGRDRDVVVGHRWSIGTYSRSRGPV